MFSSICKYSKLLRLTANIMSGRIMLTTVLLTSNVVEMTIRSYTTLNNNSVVTQDVFSSAGSGAELYHMNVQGYQMVQCSSSVIMSITVKKMMQDTYP